jgi:type IV secretion system protein VirB4
MALTLSKPKPKFKTLAEREAPVSGYIPYTNHYNANTLLTKNGQMLQIIRLEGFAFETADSDTLNIRKALRNNLFKSIAGHQYALWSHVVRHKQSVYPGGDFAPGFAQDLNDAWRMRAHGQAHYANDLYFTVLRRGHGGKIGNVQDWLRSLGHKTDKAQQLAHFKIMCKELTEIVERFMRALADYHPKRLGIEQTPAGPMSEPLRFLSRLINLEDRPVFAPTMDVSRYLAYKRPFFGARAVEVVGSTAESTRLGAMLSIKEYGPETAAGMLDAFLTLPFEFVLTQSFAFSNRAEALREIQKQQRILQQTEDLALSQVEGINQALDDASGGEVAYGEHHLTVMPIARDLKELDKAITAVESSLIDLGITPVREDLNLEPAFWAQLPGNFEYIARGAPINTRNVAGYLSMHNYPGGKLTGNHWGPAVTVLETVSGTPYYFNFHAGDVGHTTIIGPTGTGKTVLMNFLMAQSRKFASRLFAFDKDRGAETFLRAVGGRYRILGGGQPSGFNPLQLADTDENRAFLADWLAALVTSNQEGLQAHDRAIISDSIAGIYKLPRKARTLENIAPFFGIGGPGTLAGRLAQWYGKGSRAYLFGGADDILDLSDGNIFGFEMGEILEDRQGLPPVLLYLFHRIGQALDGTPTQVELDEGWALVDNPIFAPKLKDWLKTIRKLNGHVIFATQSPEDAANSSIADTLVQSAATQIYLPNPKATEVYKKVFKLTEREFDLLRTLDKASRCFLVKHGAHDSVVAKLDLGGMPEVVSVLSGTASSVRVLDEIRAKHGDDPTVWLPIFQKEVLRK